VSFLAQKLLLLVLLAGTVVRRRAYTLVSTPAVPGANLDDYWDGRRWRNASTLPPVEL
jgi:hypothetical protein